jgi:hypothetical protein
MKTQCLTFAALMGLAAGASATDSLDLQQIADQTGLSVRQVRMVLGAPTAFAEYRTSYAGAAQRVKSIYGETRYRQLVQAYRGETQLQRDGSGT